MRSKMAKPGRPAAVLYLRIDFGEQGALGPGKTRLMELIAETGSISAAGRAMGMSYRRAWLLVDSLNVAFREPLVAKQTGGSGGGGAVLTRLGREVVRRYRRIERRAASAGRVDIEALADALAVAG
jgi:molybdate transport system regulatory protein